MALLSSSMVVFSLFLFHLVHNAHAQFNQQLIASNDYNDHSRSQVFLTIVGSPLDCGGSIVSDRYILTAASCVVNRTINAITKETIAVLTVVRYWLQKGHNQVTTLQVVEEIVVPVEYKQPVFGHDIAVLKLYGEGFNSKSGVKILRVPEPNANYDNVQAKISGMGANFVKTRRDFYYQQVHVMPELACLAKTKWMVHPELKLCNIFKEPTYSPSKICNKNTGSGLVYRDTVIGVMSYGEPCFEGAKRIPTIYTKVSAFSKWIGDVLNGVRDPTTMKVHTRRVKN